MTCTLYIGNKRYSSWSMRPWVLLTALGIPFDERVHFMGGDFRQRALSTFSPTGKVPALHDGDLVVTDSLAIAEYVAEAHPAVWPADRAARAWARCAAAEMHSSFTALRSECAMNVALRVDIGQLSEGLQADIDRVARLWTEGLTKFGGPWLAGGEFTAVDAFYAPVASRLQTYSITLPEQAEEYKNRLLEHTAVVAWVQDGLKETARLEGYEAQAVRGRKLLENLAP